MSTNLAKFIDIAQSGPVGYDEDRKARFHSGGRAVLRQMADLLGLKPGTFDIRSNQGGIAVSGEITLHAEDIYIQFSQTCLGPVSGKDSMGVLWRTCKGRKDYTGGRNHWSKWEHLRDLDTFAKGVNAIRAPAFVTGAGLATPHSPER